MHGGVGVGMQWEEVEEEDEEEGKEELVGVVVILVVVVVVVVEGVEVESGLDKAGCVGCVDTLVCVSECSDEFFVLE